MNRRWAAILLVVVTICAVALVSASGRESAEEREDSEVRIGLKIAPVPLNLENKDIHQVGLGSYIVNAQVGCADCHSCPTYARGGNPYLGQHKQFSKKIYLAGGVPFGPVIVSRNITPDALGKPAGLSRDQFRHVLRTGDDPDHHGQLLQVMPWPYFQEMTNHDLDAIYAYLSAIPSEQTPPPGSCTGPGQ